MTVKASDLPAHVRKRYKIDGGGIEAPCVPPRATDADARIRAPSPVTRKRPSRAGVGDAAPCPGHCGCGEPFPNARAWERHADAEGHHVWQIDLGAT